MLGSVVAGRLGMRSVVLSGDATAEVAGAVAKMRLRLKPSTTVVRVGGESRSEWLEGRNPLVKGFDRTKARLQVCEAGTCREVLDMGDVEKALAQEE